MAAKWRWVVIFGDGQAIDIPVATGRKDAVLQAYWVRREADGQWPQSGVAEVQKRPTNGTGLLYLKYVTKPRKTAIVPVSA
jgi:hypothetical protein